MSGEEEKKTFAIRHTFTDFKNLINIKYHYGKKERHFNIPWSIRIYPFQSSSFVHVFLECHKLKGTEEWSIDTEITGELVTSNGKKKELPVKNHVFSRKSNDVAFGVGISIRKCLVDGNLTVECHVAINKMTGIEEPILSRSLINFNNEKFSDVVLVVKNRKFHVSKLYMAHHSKYFESLFMGNFEESKQSKIELKDIDLWDFQSFLLVLYGEPAINEDNIEGVLQLADMYDAKTVIRQCEQFYIKTSQQDSKFKFNMAVKYNMDQLKNKCISEIKNVEDIEKVFPEDENSTDNGTLRKLLNMSINFFKKK